jgi:hypothetical protein
MEDRQTQNQYKNKSNIDPFEVMKTYDKKVTVYEGFMLGTLIKYLMRDKGQDKEDLEKIVDYSHLLYQEFLDENEVE